MRKKIIIFHPGTQHSKRLLVELYKKRLSVKLHTGFMLSSSSLLYKALFRYIKTIQSRLISEIPSNLICNHPIIELYYFFCNRVKKIKNAIYRRNIFFQRLSIQSKHYKEADIIIGFDTSSMALLKKKGNKVFILDQSSAGSRYCEKISEELNKRYIEWADAGLLKPEQYLKEEDTEHELSDYIVAASSFSKQSLVQQGVNSNKIHVIPYGVDCKKFRPNENKKSIDKIIYLYVGDVCAGKGIPFLIENWLELRLPKAELWIVGSIKDSIKILLKQHPTIKAFGKVIHTELADIFNKAHVFVFPSFFDGFGLVLLEAMASGLPIIASTSSAGPDLIDEGVEGFLYKPEDSESLKSCLKFFIANQNMIGKMGNAARKKAEQFTWDNYGLQWERLINNIRC